MAQRRWKLEEHLEVVLLGLEGEMSVAEICHRHGLTETNSLQVAFTLSRGRQGSPGQQ